MWALGKAVTDWTCWKRIKTVYCWRHRHFNENGRDCCEAAHCGNLSFSHHALCSTGHSPRIFQLVLKCFVPMVDYPPNNLNAALFKINFQVQATAALEEWVCRALWAEHTSSWTQRQHQKHNATEQENMIEHEHNSNLLWKTCSEPCPWKWEIFHESWVSSWTFLNLRKKEEKNWRNKTNWRVWRD